MDELTLLRTLDADTPAPTRAALESAFDALTDRMAAAEQAARRHTPTRRRRRMIRLRRVALITIGAAALVTALVLTDTIGFTGLRPGATAEAAQLLGRAADMTIRTSDPVVAAGRYQKVEFRSIHEIETGNQAGETVFYTIHEDRTTWVPADVADSWTEVRYPTLSAGRYWGRGARQAAAGADALTRKVAPQVLHGRAGAFFGSADPARTPEAVNGLPHDPRLLLNHIYRVTLGSGPSADGEALVFIADTLNTGLADARTRATLYRAAALIPGVRLAADSATLDGRKGVAIGRIEPSTGIRQDLIIDPGTGVLIGEREVATRRIDLFAAGTTLGWTSASTTVVDTVPAEYRP